MMNNISLRDKDIEIKKFKSMINDFNLKLIGFNKSIINLISEKNEFFDKLNEGIKNSNESNKFLTKINDIIKEKMEKFDELIKVISLNKDQITILSKLSDVVIYPTDKNSLCNKAELIIKENPIGLYKVTQVYKCKSCNKNEATLIIKIMENSTSFSSILPTTLKCVCGPSICNGCLVDQFWNASEEEPSKFSKCKGCSVQYCLNDVHLVIQQIDSSGESNNKNNNDYNNNNNSNKKNFNKQNTTNSSSTKSKTSNNTSTQTSNDVMPKSICTPPSSTPPPPTMTFSKLPNGTITIPLTGPIIKYEDDMEEIVGVAINQESNTSKSKTRKYDYPTENNSKITNNVKDDRGVFSYHFNNKKFKF